MRMSSIKMWKDDSKSRAASESMSRDTARLWNTVPDSIKTAKTLCGAKRLIKLYSVRYSHKHYIIMHFFTFPISQ